MPHVPPVKISVAAASVGINSLSTKPPKTQFAAPTGTVKALANSRREASPDLEVVSEKTKATKRAAKSISNTPYPLTVDYVPLLNILTRPINMYGVHIAVQDRKDLDVIVKTTLVKTMQQFVEWLYGLKLIRHEIRCYKHENHDNFVLVLAQKPMILPSSGGYVWMVDCCNQPRRYVSIYTGSFFALALKEHVAPTSILKLIYHWSCQTTIVNVENWVKVGKDVISRVFNYIRCVCTVVLQDRMYDLGNGGGSVELGIVSLGTTTADGNKKAVKVR